LLADAQLQLTKEDQLMSKHGRGLHKQILAFAIAGIVGTAGTAMAAVPASAHFNVLSKATQLRSGDMVKGTVPLNKPIHVSVVLKLRNETQMHAFLAKAGATGSQHVMSAAQMRNHLPTSVQAQAVADYLKRSGFSKVSTSSNHMIVNATGSVANVQSAFQTSLVNVRTHDGRSAFANSSSVKIPAGLQDSVQAVLGLQTVHKAHFVARAGQRQNATGGINGHNPIEFASIYGASAFKPATSIDVAVWGWGSMAQTLTDLDTFTDANGLPRVDTNVVCTDYNGHDAGGIATTDPSCNNSEQGTVEWDLDSQDIIGMTGGVKSLTFYAAYGGYNDSVTNALSEIVTPTQGEPVASVINASFGECERYMDSNQGGDGSAQADDALFQIAQAQGQTFSVSTGDSGADECGDGKLDSASYPASSPYVVAVAGTTLTASGAQYGRETEWIGSGGSPSSFENAPSWQAALTYGSYKGMRGPDVAFDANPVTGAIIYNDGGMLQVGGTSLAAPLFAGAWARLLANGAVDPMMPAGEQLYAMPAGSFHDIRSGNNRGYVTGRGWDWASGRGSLDLSEIPRSHDFVENYDVTDIGQWDASTHVPRVIEPKGGNPGAYLAQGGMGTSIPTWGTASPRYQPGFNDTYKVDSVFTGDWTDAGVTAFSVDMEIIQAGMWATDRGVTLQLMQMDDSGFNVNYDATYTIPLGDAPPVGWQTYAFPVNANSRTIPAGWVFTHGDGTPATDAEWSQFLKRIDATTVGFYQPMVAYPYRGTWTVGLDNVTLRTVPPGG
jgi:hypothetical protein